MNRIVLLILISMVCPSVGWGKTPADKLQEQLIEIQKQYAEAESRAKKLAKLLRESAAPERSATQRPELRRAIAEAFALRQKLLRAELEEMKARLSQTSQSIKAREKLVDQIVDRRMKDLLNPQLDWTGSQQGTNSVTAQKEQHAGSVTLDELHGLWELEFDDDVEPEPEGASRFVVEFKKDTMTITRIMEERRYLDSVISVQLGPPATPQLVHLVRTGEDGQDQDLTAGIIEKKYGQVRIHFRETGRPPSSFSEIGDDIGSWRLRRPGTRHRHEFGVTLDSNPVTSVDVPQSFVGGLRIDSVYSGQAAELAGIERADILVGLGDWQISSIDELRWVTKQRLSGAVPFYVVRAGRTLSGTARLDISKESRKKQPPPTLQTGDVHLRSIYGKVTLKDLQGDWNLTQIDPNRHDGGQIRIQGLTMIGPALTARFRLGNGYPQSFDVFKAPSSIDSETESSDSDTGATPGIGNPDMRGIIRIVSGKVHIAFNSAPATHRPTGFDGYLTSSGEPQFFWELTRVKPVAPASEWRLKLQGQWEFDELTLKSPEASPTAIQHVYEIRDNRMQSANELGLPEWFLRFASCPKRGKHQAVDVCMDKAGTQFMPGIIEITGDQVRICLANSFDKDAKRPTEFKVSEENDIFLLRRLSAPVTELEGEWRQTMIESEPEPDSEVPLLNVTISGSEWTYHADSKRDVVDFTLDPVAKTIVFTNQPDRKFAYFHQGDNLQLRHREQTIYLTRGHRTGPDSVTELEGEWHVVSQKDSKGKPRQISPYNMTFKGNRQSFVYSGGKGERRVEIYPNKKQIRYFSEGEYSSFFMDTYVLADDTLTLRSSPPGIMVLKRGHMRIPKVLPDANDQQKTLWRSAMVAISVVKKDPTDQREYYFGRGVVVTKDGMILTHVDSKSKSGFATTDLSSITAEYDDGSRVQLKIVEQHDFGLMVLKPTAPGVQVNHFFELSKTGSESGDQVYSRWTTKFGGENFTPVELVRTNRRIAANGLPAWQLKRPPNPKPEGLLPVLNADGELQAITLISTGDLFLALPVEQFPKVFPVTFGQD